MAVYLTVIFLEFIAYAISLNFKEEQQNKVFLTIGSIPVILVSALRYRSVGGNDPINYYNNFVLSQKFDLPTFLETAPMEDGYLIFVKMLSSIFKDPQWLFFWVALVCTVCVSYF
ncbi:MAG: EpsG family protein, partial [Oscillospiraceae bacterium]|nr:EpsG family protein [Oscillospiraceae bacterium]